jgi:hypothetical protein
MNIRGLRCAWPNVKYTISLQVSVEEVEEVYFTAEILFEVCIEAIPTNIRLYMYLCLISLLSPFIICYSIFINGNVYRRSQ